MVQLIPIFCVILKSILFASSNENCGENEVFDPCGKISRPQASQSIEKASNCQLGTPQSKEKFCEGFCVCKPGFTRNKINECISEEDASKCCGPHEYFSCGPACDNVCETLKEINQTSCPIINIKCNPMCYCESGYARNANNICIPIEECESKYWKCGKNEECIPFHEVKSQYKTHKMLKSCKGFCVCKPGFIRNKVNECTPVKDAWHYHYIK